VATRIFVILAPEDYLFFDRLKEQARTTRVDVEFDRMQVKQPWVPMWKGQSRTRIFGCAGALVLISKKTKDTGGISWELECAQKAEVPVLAVRIDKSDGNAVPVELKGKPVIEWNWAEIARFIQTSASAANA